MRRSRRAALGVTALVAVTIVGVEALAHGPAPSPLRVLHSVGERPDLIQTNIGIGLHRQDDLYRYVCPSRWGDLETPLSAALDGETILVAGAADFVVSGERGCDFSPLTSDVATTDVVRLTSGAGAIWGVARGEGDGGGGRVLSWRPGDGAVEVIDDVADQLDGIVVVDGLLRTSGARPAGLSVTRYAIAPDGSLGPATSARPTDVAGLEGGVEGVQRLTLRAASGARLDFAAITDDGVAWLRSDNDGETLRVVAVGERSVHGPIGVCGGFVAAVDNVLVPDPDAPPTCAIDATFASPITCLGVQGALTYACADRALHALTEVGGALEARVAFELGQMVGPMPACEDTPEAEGACRQDWLHYGGEAGLLDDVDPFGDDAADIEPPDNGDDTGASVDTPDAGSGDGQDTGPDADAGGGPPPAPSAGGSCDEGCSVPSSMGGAHHAISALVLLGFTLVTRSRR